MESGAGKNQRNYRLIKGNEVIEGDWDYISKELNHPKKLLQNGYASRRCWRGWVMKKIPRYELYHKGKYVGDYYSIYQMGQDLFISSINERKYREKEGYEIIIKQGKHYVQDNK